MELNESNDDLNAHAAVLVLHDKSSNSLILTKRSEELHHHPGEISFPGGLWEIEDENLYATALREVYEEIGIEANRITLIKELQIERTLIGDIIHPWLVSIKSIQPYQLNHHEVIRLIKIPLNLVQDSDNYKEFIIEKRGYHIKSYKFLGCDELIWGATARIMRQLTNLSSDLK